MVELEWIGYHLRGTRLRQCGHSAYRHKIDLQLHYAGAVGLEPTYTFSVSWVKARDVNQLHHAPID